MSVNAYIAVWDHTQHKAAKRLLMVALADYADPDEFRCWPSARTLAQRVGVTKRYINKMLAQMSVTAEKAYEMQERGDPLPEIIAIPGGDGAGDTTTYYLNLPGAKRGALRIMQGGVIIFDDSRVNQGTPLRVNQSSRRVNQSSRRVNQSSRRVNQSSHKGEPEDTRSVTNPHDPAQIPHDPPRSTAQQITTNNGATSTPPPTPSPQNDQEANVITRMRGDGADDEEIAEILRRMRNPFVIPKPRERSNRR